MSRRLSRAVLALWVTVILVLAPGRYGVAAAAPTLKITPVKVANEIGSSDKWSNTRTGLQGIWLHAEGWGFKAGSPVKLVPLPGSEAFWSNASLNGINGEGYTPGPDGTFRTYNLDIAIPSPVGRYGLKAIQGNLHTEAYVEVRPATPINVQVTPDSAYPGQVVTVNITGLWPDQDPATVAVYTMFGEMTPPDSDSGFSVSYGVASQSKVMEVPPDGSVSLTWAVGTVDGTLESRFRSGLDERPCTFVVEQAGRKAATAPVRLRSGSPSLRVDLESIPNGGCVTVLGKDFTPGLPVTLEAEDAASGVGVDIEYAETPTSTYYAGTIEVVPSENGAFNRRINPRPAGDSGVVKIVAKQMSRPAAYAYVTITESQGQIPSQEPTSESPGQTPPQQPASESPQMLGILDGGVRSDAQSITVSWLPPDPVSGKALLGYYVYRSMTLGGTSTAGRIHDFPITETTFVDSSVNAGKTYFYAVRAVYADGSLSALSDEVAASLKTASTTITFQIGNRIAAVNGVEQELLAAPTLREDRACVPLRFIGEAMGATLDWDGAERKVTYTFGDRRVVLWVDRTRVVVNGIEQEYAPAPFIVDGTTLVPVRLVAEALGFSVSWDPATRTVTITR
ncbi:MAG: stalk domain-containing protein [Ignavibacteriales bacterium]